MALTLFNMNATLGLDSSEFNSGVTDAGTKTEGLSAKTVAMGQIMADAFELVIQKVTEYGSKIVAVGMDQESALAKVNTIMDTSKMSTEAMSGAIKDLSSEMGVSVTELSDTVYNAISATGDTANAVSLAGQASKLATAGFTDTSSALSVLTTAMNAYGMSADEAEYISDSLIQVQNLGVTTVSELSSVMGKAIATASAYGVNLENLESAYVSLTKNGIPTADSTTYISSMLKELGDSGSDVSKILQEKTGQSFDQLMSDGKSLGDVLGILNEAVDGDSTALINLWGSAEAGKASNAIVSQGLETFNDNLQQIQDTTGATETAFETMADTMQHKVDVFKTTGQNLMSMLYEGMGGNLGQFVTFGTEALNSIMEGFEENGVEGLANHLGWMISEGLEMLSDYIPEAVEIGLDFLDTLLGTLSENTHLAVFGSDMLMRIMDGFIDHIPSIAYSIGQFIEVFGGQLAEKAPDLMTKGVVLITTIVQSLLENMDLIISGALSLIVGLAQGLVDALPTLIDSIPLIVEAIVNALVNNIPLLIQCALTLVIALGEGLIKAIPSLVKAIPTIVKALVKGFSDLVSKFIEIGKNIVEGIRRGIANAWNQLVDWIVGLCSSLVSTVKSFFGIKSPSKVFAEIGGYLAEGLGVGWEDEIGDVKDSITKDLDFSAVPFGGSSSSSNSWKAGAVYNQTINVNREIATADELAREIRLESRYGLMVGA